MPTASWLSTQAAPEFMACRLASARSGSCPLSLTLNSARSTLRVAPTPLPIPLAYRPFSRGSVPFLDGRHRNYTRALPTGTFQFLHSDVKISPLTSRVFHSLQILLSLHLAPAPLQLLYQHYQTSPPPSRLTRTHLACYETCGPIVSPTSPSVPPSGSFLCRQPLLRPSPPTLYSWSILLPHIKPSSTC